MTIRGIALRCLGILPVGLCALTLAGEAAARQTPAKNVILLLGDGNGYNPIAATSFYEGRSPIFQGSDWVKHAVSVYSLDNRTAPLPGLGGLAQNPGVVYDPSKAWDTTPVGTTTGGFPDHFAGYRWNKQTAPDSAPTASALVNGTKSYNNAINVDGNGTPLRTFAEISKDAGKSVGVVTTVQISDATPAAFGGAHNVARANRTSIADELLTSGKVDVLMGTGNPDFDNNGKPRSTPDNSWISASTWNQLKAGTHPGGWDLIQDKQAFQDLANNPSATGHVLGIAESFLSLQENRGGANPATEAPYSVPLNANVPDLMTMTQGALNILGQNQNGFFLGIEGGAIDRAEHDNNLGRMIEEGIEFNNTVQLVSDYLTANTNGNNWDNTLVVVTADHDHLLFGPGSDTDPFQNLLDNGAGNLPGYDWQSNGHSNRLVPLFARGPGSELFARYADQLDAYTDAQGRTFGRGLYLDQTEVFSVLNRATAVPEPSSLALACLGLAGVVLTIRRRRRAA